jgi:hypothetical protein
MHIVLHPVSFISSRQQGLAVVTYRCGSERRSMSLFSNGGANPSSTSARFLYSAMAEQTLARLLLDFDFQQTLAPLFDNVCIWRERPIEWCAKEKTRHGQNERTGRRFLFFVFSYWRRCNRDRWI